MALITLVFGALLAQDARSPQEEALKRLTADLTKLIKAADADGNGTLSAVEFRAFSPAVRKAADALLDELDPAAAKKRADKDLKKYDTNGDGKLDEAEKKALDEAKRLKDIKAFDWDGDGKLNEREKTAMQWAEEGRLDGAFRKLDADANGQLSQEEITAGLASLAGIKIKKAP